MKGNLLQNKNFVNEANSNSYGTNDISTAEHAILVTLKSPKNMPDKVMWLRHIASKHNCVAFAASDGLPESGVVVIKGKLTDLAKVEKDLDI